MPLLSLHSLKRLPRHHCPTKEPSTAERIPPVELYSRTPVFATEGNKIIRLLKLAPGGHEDAIHGTLETVDLENSPSYETLSYAGDVQRAKAAPRSA